MYMLLSYLLVRFSMNEMAMLIIVSNSRPMPDQLNLERDILARLTLAIAPVPLR